MNFYAILHELIRRNTAMIRYTTFAVIQQAEHSQTEAIKQWLLTLDQQEALWHMDDHPNDIVWSIGQQTFTSEQIFGIMYEQLVKDYELVTAYCDINGIDIFELYP